MNAPEQTPAAKAAYDARWQRILDCVALKQADRMPVIMYATYWLAKYRGRNFKDFMLHFHKTQANA